MVQWCMHVCPVWFMVPRSAAVMCVCVLILFCYTTLPMTPAQTKERADKWLEFCCFFVVSAVVAGKGRLRSTWVLWWRCVVRFTHHFQDERILLLLYTTSRETHYFLFFIIIMHHCSKLKDSVVVVVIHHLLSSLFIKSW